MRCLFYMIHSLCINFDMIKGIIFGCFRASYRIKNTFLHFITIFDRSKCFDKEKATHLRLEISQLSYYGYLISNLEKLRHIFKLRVSYPGCSWIKHSVENSDESEVWERVNLLRHSQSEWSDWVSFWHPMYVIIFNEANYLCHCSKHNNAPLLFHISST